MRIDRLGKDTGFVRITRALSAVATALALLPAAGCSSDSDDRGTFAAKTKVETVTYLTGAGIQGREAYIYVAIDKGYFRDAGLDVQVKPGNGTEQNLKLLQAGRADFAIVDITAALIAYGKRTFKDFTVVSAIQQRNLSCIMALSSSGITGPKDLAGKTIAYIPGGVVHTLFGVYARLAGVDASKIRWVVVPVAQMGPSLASGAVDAATQFVVGKPSIEAGAQGRKAVILPFSTYLNDLYGNGLAVSKAALAANPDRVRRFNQAMLRGLAYAVNHPDEAGQIYAKYQRLQPAAAAAAENTLMAPYVLSSAGGTAVGALESQRIARNIAAIQGAGVIPNTITPTEVVSFDYPPAS
jgi:NitT/TauT family transport system substrate-binding protein